MHSAETPVGRARERADLEALLEAGARWVTLWGPAGVGKSTLAATVAASAQEHGFDTVLLSSVERSPTLDGLLARIAELLPDLPAAANGGSRSRQIGAALAARGSVLLVLDGLEGLADVVGSTLELWLRLAPELTILVCSRRRCDSPNEHSYELELLSRKDAAELFVARFARAQPKQALPDPSFVERVVDALDGLPLAIEVAASTLALLGPTEVAVSDLLHVEAGHGRQSLSRVLELSWSLLSESQRQALAQLSVCERDFSLADAEAIVHGDEAGTPSLVACLYALRELALLRSSRGRFALLSTVRAFAFEKLAQSGQIHETRMRHAEHFLRRASHADEAVDERLGALDFVLQTRPDGWLRDAQIALVRLEPALDRLGRAAAVVQLADRAVDWADALEEWAAPAACVLRARGVLRRTAGLLEQATQDFERAMEIARDLGASHTASRTATALAVTHLAAGRLTDAHAAFDEALEHASRCDERTCEVEARMQLADAVSLAGDHGRAQEIRAHAWQLAREARDRHLAARAATSLAVESLTRGDLESFERIAHDSLRELRDLGDVHGAAILTCNIGVANAMRGRLDEAMRCFREAARWNEEVGDVANAAHAMLHLGFAAQELQPTAGMPELQTAYELAGQARVAWIELLACAGLAVGYATNGLLGQYEAMRDRTEQAMGRFDLPTVLAAVRVRLSAAALAASKHEQGDHALQADGSGPRLEEEAGMLVAGAMRLLERIRTWAPDGSITGTYRKADTILVATGCEWFRPPRGSWVDLRRRTALRRLLSALATRSWLTCEDLVRVGWPDERILPKAAHARVHVAVSTLRKLGLPLVREEEKGYAIDPRYTVLTGYAAEVRFEPMG